MADFSQLLPLFGSAFADWAKLFLSPLSNFDMLWIIVPIWGVWIFSEFFQEKKGTSFGNAITNGAVMLFVGVDWIRYLVRSISSGELALDSSLYLKVAISAFVIIVSTAIIILGIRGRKIVKYIGRVRESTYLMLMFTPIVYGVVSLSWRNLGIIAFFFPVFYIIVAALDRWIPNPKTYELEEGANANDGYLDMGKGMDFGKGKF